MCFLPSKSPARADIPLIYCKISLTKTYFIKCKLKVTASVQSNLSTDAIRMKRRRAEAKARNEEDKKRRKLLRIQAGINAADVLTTNGEIYAPSAPIP